MSRNLKQELKDNNLTITDFVRKCDLNYMHIYRIINNKKPVPESLLALFDAVKEELVTEKNNLKAKHKRESQRKRRDYLREYMQKVREAQRNERKK